MAKCKATFLSAFYKKLGSGEMIKRQSSSQTEPNPPSLCISLPPKHTGLRRLFSITLLFLVAFQTLGCLALTLAALREARADRALLSKAGETAGLARVIVLPAEEFHRSRSGAHEFHYEGCLYDILKTAPAPGGKIAVTALRDEHEQELLNHLSRCFQAGNRSRHPLAGFIVKLLPQAFVLPAETALSLPAPEVKTNHCFYFSGLRSVFRPFTVAPPPWRA